MFNSNLHLHVNLINHKKLEVTPTRDGFGRGLVEAGKRDNTIVALTADLAESVYRGRCCRTKSRNGGIRYGKSWKNSFCDELCDF